MKDIEIGKFPNREFSFFCEFKVAYELQKRGWHVYQPLIDRYIDLIAVKNGMYRTIQVKSSRVENLDTLSKDKYESYGLTMKPKDLFHDVRHFYIWVFIDKDEKFHYFILNVKDFIDIRYYKLPTSSRRKHPSLLMRSEWRWGTDRLHPHHFFQTDKWEVEGVELKDYENKWENLEINPSKPSYNFECFKATEVDKKWIGYDKNVVNKWKRINLKVENKLKKYPEVYESSKRLLKGTVDENEGIIDAHLIRLTEEEVERIFRETGKYWEIFLPLDRTDHILLFRPVCATCGKYWNTSLKECFYCKAKYFRIKVCERCNKPYPENVKPTQRCDCNGRIIKKCINCGEVEEKRKRVFVPITFCWYCGTRQNKFEFKHIEIG